MSKEYLKDQNALINCQQKPMIDPTTGEEIIFEQITKTIYGSKNFWKVYLMDFLSVLGILNSKQLDVFVYICENTQQSTNLFIGTYDKIVKDTGISRQTVAHLLKKLQENNFIKKVQSGVWFVNPNVLMKGNENKRQMLLTYYQSDVPIDKLSYQRIQGKEIPKTDERKTDDDTRVLIHTDVSLSRGEQDGSGQTGIYQDGTTEEGGQFLETPSLHTEQDG